MAKEQLFQYNIAYDKRETDTAFIRTQMETHLRERFNALLSQFEYGIVNGHLVREGTSEPFINSIIRGRNKMRMFASNSEDFDREDAEVIGFGNIIDSQLSNPNTPLETKFLSISPPGGKYQHNFYDIFTLKDRNGARYVESRRYSSGLTPVDYARQFGLDPQNPPTAADFLANPKIIPEVSITAEQIHQMLHVEHDYMNERDFSEIWRGVQTAVSNYLLNRDANSFNAVLNLADKVWESQKRRKAGESYTDYSNFIPTAGQLERIGDEPVRQAGGDCPGKSGAEDKDSPFSVSEADYKFDKQGTCRVCGIESSSLGPCYICRPCDTKLRREEQPALAA